MNDAYFFEHQKQFIRGGGKGRTLGLVVVLAKKTVGIEVED